MAMKHPSLAESAPAAGGASAPDRPATPSSSDGVQGAAHVQLAERLLAVPDARLDGQLRGPLPSAAETGALASDLFDVLFPTSGGLRADCDTDQRECLARALASLERRLSEAVFLGL